MLDNIAVNGLTHYHLECTHGLKPLNITLQIQLYLKNAQKRFVKPIGTTHSKVFLTYWFVYQDNSIFVKTYVRLYAPDVNGLSY